MSERTLWLFEWRFYIDLCMNIYSNIHFKTMIFCTTTIKMGKIIV